MVNKLLKIAIPLLVALTSFWIGRILSYSIILGILVLVLSITLNIRKIFISIILLLVFFGLTFDSALDRTIFVTDRLEKDVLQAQDRFAGAGFGKLYMNRVGLFVLNKLSTPFYKIEKNFFSGLDPNVYFFAGHPRESKDAYEFEKFSFVLLPFFLVGVYLSFKKDFRRELLFVVTVAALNIAFSTKFILGPILFFPVIVKFISLGLEETYLWSKRKFSR